MYDVLASHIYHALISSAKGLTGSLGMRTVHDFGDTLPCCVAKAQLAIAIASADVYLTLCGHSDRVVATSRDVAHIERCKTHSQGPHNEQSHANRGQRGESTA